ncbi:MAG: steroid delta-isomerase, partial [Afipia sp.]|nr:steroid delta-isomerase [Afipia sp.]
TAPGQAYFINDGEPLNMFEFARPVITACGRKLPTFYVSGKLVHRAMMAWQWLHFKFALPEPLIEPLAVERLYLNNYFSIAKAKRDLGYEPLFNTEQAMKECMPYYVDLFRQMEAADAKQ